MNSEPTNWIPGIAVFVLGALASIAFLIASKKKVTANVDSADLELKETYAKRLAELREHVANKHLFSPHEYESEKARLEQAAAQVLRSQSDVKHEALKRQARLEKKAIDRSTDRSMFARNPLLSGLAVALGVVAFFAVLTQQLMTSATVEAEQSPAMAGPGAPQEDARLNALAAKLEADPSDVESIADLAHYLLKRQGFEEASALAGRLAQIDPFYVRGRVARAVLSAVSGNVGVAVNDLERLGTSYPEAYEAHMYVAMISMESEPARAADHLELFLQKAPANEQPPMFRRLIAELRSRPAAPQGGPK